MTYSPDFRRQFLKSIDDGMTFAGVAGFYNLSPTTMQNRKRRIHSKSNSIKYQITCSLMMLKNIPMITSMSKHVV